MRAALDMLYRLSGWAAGICLMLIGLSILGQIAGRFFNLAFDATEISGFFMAGATFLGLAYTFSSGAHIRVTLLIGRLGTQGKRRAEIWSCLVTAIAAAYWSWQAIDMVRVSILVHDVSPGLMAVPFWIPQTAFAAGLVVFTIAVVDELVQVIMGKVPSFADAEAEAIGEIEAVHIDPQALPQTSGSR